MIEWERIKKEVEKTKLSYKDIAFNNYISYSALMKKIKSDNWNVEHRKKAKKSNVTKDTPFSKTTLRKIEEIKKELGENYLSIDEPLIIMYANNYRRYLELEQELNKKGIISKSLKTGSEYLSPLFTAFLSIQKNLITIANQLGLSIASRKKLGLDFTKEDKDNSIFNIVDLLNNTKDNDQEDLGI